MLFIIMLHRPQKTANKQNKHWNCRWAFVFSSVSVLRHLTISIHIETGTGNNLKVSFSSLDADGATWQGTFLSLLQTISLISKHSYKFQPKSSGWIARFWMPASITGAIDFYLFWWCYIARRAAVCCLLQCPAAAPCSCLVHTPRPAYLCPGTAGHRTHNINCNSTACATTQMMLAIN